MSPSSPSGVNGIFSPNSTLPITGLSIICEGVCHSTGSDYLLDGNAQFIIAPKGEWHFMTPTIVYQGASGGGGSINNYGELHFTAPNSSPTFMRIPVVNRGLLAVGPSSHLTFLSNMQQDDTSATFHIGVGGVVSAGEADNLGVIELLAGSLRNDGLINSNVEMGGELTQSNPSRSDQPSINGDLIFGPTASLTATMTQQQSPVLFLNGTVYLAGLANLSWHNGPAGSTVPIIRTNRRIIGQFHQLASNTREGQPSYTVVYAPNSADMVTGPISDHVTPLVGCPFGPDCHSATSDSPRRFSVNIAPSPVDAGDDGASFMTVGDMGHSHHSMHSPKDPDHSSTDPTQPVDPNNLSNSSHTPTPIAPPPITVERDRSTTLGMKPKAAQSVLILFIALTMLFIATSIGLAYYVITLKRSRPPALPPSHRSSDPPHAPSHPIPVPTLSPNGPTFTSSTAHSNSTSTHSPDPTHLEGHPQHAQTLEMAA